MINIFNLNYDELGSLDKNLVLLTLGKVKIRYGRKFVDLLNENGELNVQIPEIFKKISSKSEINGDGIYTLDDKVYISAGGVLIELSPNDGEEAFYVSYIVKQETTDELKKQAQENIGLTFDSLSEAHKNITNGIVFIGDSIYYINEDEHILLSLTTPLREINQAGLTDPYEGAIIQFKGGHWTYSTIPDIRINSDGELELNNPLEDINNAGLTYPEGGSNQILVWKNTEQGWKYESLPSAGTSLTFPLSDINTNNSSLTLYNRNSKSGNVAIVWSTEHLKWLYESIGLQVVREAYLEVEKDLNNPKKFKLTYWGKNKDDNNSITTDVSLTFSGTSRFELDTTPWGTNDKKNIRTITLLDDVSEEKYLNIKVLYDDSAEKVIKLTQKVPVLTKVFITSDKNSIPAKSDNLDERKTIIEYWGEATYNIAKTEGENTVNNFSSYTADTTYGLICGHNEEHAIITVGQGYKLNNHMFVPVAFANKADDDRTQGNVVFTITGNGTEGVLTEECIITQGGNVVLLSDFDFMVFYYDWGKKYDDNEIEIATSTSTGDLDTLIKTENTGILVEKVSYFLDEPRVRIVNTQLDNEYGGYNGLNRMTPPLSTPLKYTILHNSEITSKLLIEAIPYDLENPNNSTYHVITRQDFNLDNEYTYTYKYNTSSTKDIKLLAYNVNQYITYGGDSNRGNEEIVIHWKKILTEALAINPNVKEINVNIYTKWYSEPDSLLLTSRGTYQYKFNFLLFGYNKGTNLFIKPVDSYQFGIVTENSQPNIVRITTDPNGNTIPSSKILEREFIDSDVISSNNCGTPVIKIVYNTTTRKTEMRILDPVLASEVKQNTEFIEWD